jgi:hypothetical protein
MVTVYETLVDGREDGPAGPAGDGTFVVRRRKEADMKAFVVGKTCYGKPATYNPREVSVKLARRWGLA